MFSAVCPRITFEGFLRWLWTVCLTFLVTPTCGRVQYLSQITFKSFLLHHLTLANCKYSWKHSCCKEHPEKPGFSTFCPYFQKFNSPDRIGGYKVILNDLTLLFLARFQRLFISRQKLPSERWALYVSKELFMCKSYEQKLFFKDTSINNLPRATKLFIVNNLIVTKSNK